MSARQQTILVTGSSGFVGRLLVDAIGSRFPATKVVGADRAAGHAGSHVLDLAQPASVDALIADVKPDAVVHLAAITSVPASIEDPRTTWGVNVFGTLELVLALQRHAPACHLVYVSSAEAYGRSAFSGVPVTEEASLLPANPYAASKAAADMLVREAAGRGLLATIVRPFNHTGPGQDERFVIPAFCGQVARIEKGKQPNEIRVGELDDERDFLDVSDVVEFYLRVLTAGPSLPSGTVLNVASGAARRIGDILDFILASSHAKISVTVDPARLRPQRVPRIVGDASRARNLLGWAPARPFEATLLDTLAYWRASV